MCGMRQGKLAILNPHILKKLQVQTKKQSCALLQGSMSGFMDTSKIDKKLLNWMYEEPKQKNINK